MGQSVSYYYNNITSSSPSPAEAPLESDQNQILFIEAQKNIDQHDNEIKKIGSAAPKLIGNTVALAITVKSSVNLKDLFDFIKNVSIFKQTVYCKLCSEFEISESDETEFWNYDEFSQLLQYGLFLGKIAKYLIDVEERFHTNYTKILHSFLRLAFIVITKKSAVNITSTQLKTFLNIILKNDKFAWVNLVFDYISDETKTKVTKESYRKYQDLTIDFFIPLVGQELLNIDDNQQNEWFIHQCQSVIKEKSNELVDETFFLMNETRNQDYVSKDVFLEKYYDAKIQTYLNSFTQFLLKDTIKEYRQRRYSN